MLIAYFVIGLGSTVAILSFFAIRYAANRPANGELAVLQQLKTKIDIHKLNVEQCLLVHTSTKRHVMVE